MVNRESSTRAVQQRIIPLPGGTMGQLLAKPGRNTPVLGLALDE